MEEVNDTLCFDILWLWWFISGTEALFADLAHFPVSAVQIAFTLLVFPCLLLAYSGQAAYLMNNLDHAQDAFYRSIPGLVYNSVSNESVFVMHLHLWWLEQVYCQIS